MGNNLEVDGGECGWGRADFVGANEVGEKRHGGGNGETKRWMNELSTCIMGR